MKGLIIEPEDCDAFVIHLPDDTYVAVFPMPLCDCRHKDPEDAATCEKVKERIKENERNARYTERGGYL